MFVGKVDWVVGGGGWVRRSIFLCKGSGLSNR
jgi:hypothetical protein